MNSIFFNSTKFSPNWAKILKLNLNPRKTFFCFKIEFFLFLVSIFLLIFLFQSWKKENETLSIFSMTKICQKNSKESRNSSWDLEKIRKPSLGRRKNCNRVKFGTLIFIPNRSDNYYLIQFVTFIYASWIHIYRFYKNYSSDPNCVNVIDLIIYCQEPSCDLLPKICGHFSKISPYYETPKCFFHEIKPFDFQYQAMNSFAFLLDPDFEKTIVPQYDFLIRTDIDAFLGPAILNWIPERPFLTGPGAYCHKFNKMKLEKVFLKLSLKISIINFYFDTANLLFR